MKQIHFHSGDSRFCGAEEKPRRFTGDANEVTCERCQSRDTFMLSDSGMQLLRELGYVAADGKII